MQFRKYGLRFSLIFLILIVALCGFSIKLVLIQIFKSSHLASLAEKQHRHSIEIEPIRGTIYDRNLRPMALNISAYSLFANPRMMTAKDKAKALKYLPELLNIKPSFVKERLARKKYFIWIKRKMPVDMADKIKALKIAGLSFMNESKRFYPNGALAAHVIGYAGTDNTGLEGMELYYEKYLKGEAGWSQIIRDAKQQSLMLENYYVAPKHGKNLVLTIDETVQYITERALDRGVEKHNPKGATAIVMDVKTGEIIALANRPTYNLDDVANSSLESRTNRAVSYVYEPGSVLKMITAAAALEEGAFKESDEIFCENGKYRVANHILTDHRPHGTLTFEEVIKLSSNIGTVKIAQKLGPDIIYKYGQRFRLGKKTNISMKGEVSGWLKAPKLWSKTTIGAIPIGYEVTVTPIQLVCAVAAVANGGVYMKPQVVKYIKDQQDNIIKSFKPEVVDRIISIDTANRVNEILSKVVEDGTGKRARIDGVKVAGKTGTARKVVDGAYAKGKYYASFVGFAPADNPRIAAVVIFDEPHPSYFGGTVSAPVFKEIVENALKYLEISG